MALWDLKKTKIKSCVWSSKGALLETNPTHPPVDDGKGFVCMLSGTVVQLYVA